MRDRPHDVESWRAFWALPAGHEEFTTVEWDEWHQWRCSVLEGVHGQGIYYDRAEADYHLDFYCALRHTKGEWQGDLFVPLPWQEHQVLRPVFGYLKSDGRRLYRQAFVFIPKKNGKSELAAGTVLDQLFREGEPGAEVYGAAADHEQAGFLFDVVHGMVKQSRWMQSHSKVYTSTKRLTVPNPRGSDSRYVVLSKELSSKEGFSIQCLVIDEVHVVPDKMIDVLTDGSGAARRQPIFLYTTTAGESIRGRAHELFEYAQGVEDGQIEDPSFLPVLYFVREQEGESWNDIEVLKRVNPSLGHTLSLDDLLSDLSKAMNIPSKQSSFKRRRANIFVADDANRYIPMDHWMQCGATGTIAELASLRREVLKQAKGRECMGWLDLSSRIDLTTFGLLVPFGPDRLVALPWFFLPRENIAARSKKDRALYQQWIDAGFIEQTEGSGTDQRAVRQKIVDLREEGFRFREISYDDWNAGKIETELTDEDGFDLWPVPQNVSRMNAPTKELLGLVLDHHIDHLGNPVLTWMAENMTVTSDKNERVQPSKAKSYGRIDGIVGIILALDGLAKAPVETPSVYETRGIRSC